MKLIFNIYEVSEIPLYYSSSLVRRLHLTTTKSRYKTPNAVLSIVRICTRSFYSQQTTYAKEVILGP